jgi:all-trans-retinol 13,14-reductase
LSLVDSKKKRIPGQFYILISFVPWILYWVLSGVVGEAGILVALATSLLITAPQLRGKEPNLMDVATTLYFVIATLGAYIFSASMFIERSGFLGYLALFVMAIFSIAVKKLFTFQASKRDYPEVYWRNRLFLSINNDVSGLWAVVFLTSALMYLLPGGLLSLALSSALIALGVAPSRSSTRSKPLHA